MKKERFDAITDAILAIVITIMVLELKLPEINRENLIHIIFLISIYGISFITIAILWLNHHNFTKDIKVLDSKSVWLNFCLLFFTTLLPKALGTLSENFFNANNHIFYAIILGLICMFYAILNARVMKITNTFDLKTNFFNWSSVGLYFLAIFLSQINIYFSGFIFALFPILYFLVSNKKKF